MKENLELNTHNSNTDSSSLDDNNKFHDRFLWPGIAMILGLRPLHHFKTRKLAEIEENESVLEIGSGYPLWKIYSQQVGEGLFVSLDIDSFIQKSSKKLCFWIDKLQGKENTSEEFTVANGTLLPFADESFDVFIASNFREDYQHLSEAYPVLRPGGRLITSFTEVLSMGPINDRVEFCKEIGFEDVEIAKGSISVVFYPFLSSNNFILATKPDSQTKI